MLLASNYDQSRFLKAQDLPGEKKFRIKSVTEEEIGIGKDKERKLVVWFTNDAALFSTALTTERSAEPSAIPAIAGPAKLSLRFRQWRNSAVR
jgi:hypothetical protein